MGYAVHARAIQEWAAPAGRLRADRLSDVGGFVLTTIREPLYRAVDDTRALLAGDTGHLFAWKAHAYAELRERRRDVAWILRDHAGDVDAQLFHASKLHGFGLAKAGFLLQLTLGVSGCLDTHNLERYGLDARAFRVDGTSDATRLARVRAYNSTVAHLGGTAALWDTWCAYVADREPNRYRDAWHVSELHSEALGVAPF